MKTNNWFIPGYGKADSQVIKVLVSKPKDMSVLYPCGVENFPQFIQLLEMGTRLHGVSEGEMGTAGPEKHESSLLNDLKRLGNNFYFYLYKT